MYVRIDQALVFESDYENKMNQILNKYQDWIKNNLGYSLQGNYRYSVIEEMAYYLFEFESEEDAMAFKLRWM